MDGVVFGILLDAADALTFSNTFIKFPSMCSANTIPIENNNSFDNRSEDDNDLERSNEKLLITTILQWVS